MVTAAARTAQFACQATWQDNGLHVWGWDGHRPAPAGWLHRRVSDELGATGSVGPRRDVTRLTVDVEGAPRLTASSIRLDLDTAVGWLGAHLGACTSDASESAIWFGQVGVLAARLVAARRTSPTVVLEHGRTVARWAPVLGDDVRPTVEALHRSAPAVCHDATDGATGHIVGRFVDALCRQQLRADGWRPPTPGRDPASRANAALLRALCGDDPSLVLGRTEQWRLTSMLQQAHRRAAGEPVVSPRLRLDSPDDPDGTWWVELQLVDDHDPGRWCNAADVWTQSPLAVDLAGDVGHLGVLESSARAAATAIGAAVPMLDALAAERQPDAVPFELGEVGDLLDTAPDALDRLGITMLGPEHLVRAKVSLQGTARPAVVDDVRPASHSRLNNAAVVDWDIVVDDGDACQRLDAAGLVRAETSASGLLRVGGRWVRIEAEALRNAKRKLDACRAERTAVGAAELLALAADLQAEAAALGVGSSVTGLDGWTADLLAGLDDACLEEAQEPDRFVGTLRHYQRRGLAWLRLLADLGLGGCLADDMGLGKTATTLAHLADRPGPHLVVCPLSVVRNWHVECTRFTPSMSALVHHGSERTRGAALFPLEGQDIVITTYGLLTRDLDALAAIEWTTVVLDEAQTVKNSVTRAARAVRKLRASQTIALTGTPVENRLGDLWSVLDTVQPGVLGSKRSFHEAFGAPIERHRDPVATARLRTLTGPLVLRRTKTDKDLLPDLPDKIEQVAWAVLSEEQAVLYRAIVDQLLIDAAAEQGMRRRGIVLAAITRLKQICNHPAHALGDGSRLAGRSGKLARFDGIVDDILDRSEGAERQTLVFTQFKAMGHLLRQHLLEQRGLAVPFLEGSVSAAGRAAMVERFQAGADPLLLVSLRAGGTGLNLTAASHVIHYDRWWNPAVEDQATDRAWRIGQQRTVLVHKLVTEGTIEERIADVIDEKRTVADAAVGRVEAQISELSTDQLAALVRLDERRRRERGLS